MSPDGIIMLSIWTSLTGITLIYKLYFFLQLVHRATAAMLGALAALSLLSYMKKVNLPFCCSYLPPSPAIPNLNPFFAVPLLLKSKLVQLFFFLES